MPMDGVPTQDGHWTFRLGPVEKWVTGIVAATFLGGLLMGGRWFALKVDTQGDKIQTLVTQQAVANGALATISAQLTDVPQLRSDVVELKVRVQALEENQKELRSVRGLR